MRITTALLLCLAALSACGETEKQRIDRTILLTVENRTGAQLWYVSYADCGSDNYAGLLYSDEYLADGDDISSDELEPGCYDLYIEDEFGCFSDNTTDGNLPGGQEFTWTAKANDLTCP
jgi:hypothetical protein